MPGSLGTPEPRVLVSLPSGPELAHTVTDHWDRGTALALLKPSATPAVRRDVERRFDPHLVIEPGGGGQTVRRTRRAGPRHPSPVERGSITVFTSGTTGPPKGVVVPRSAVAANALKTADPHGFGRGRPHGTCLELFHVNALVMSLLGTKLAGETLITDHSGDPHRFFARLAEGRARTASVNPVELRRIVDARPAWPESLDYLITAAGPCSVNLASAFHRLYGPRLRQGYGMSEAVNFSFMMPELDPADFRRHYLRARPPVGLPLPGTEYRIEDDHLVIRSPDVMSGYLGGAGPDVIDDEGWLRTGDCAVLRDGFLVLRGRSADALRREGGRRILPPDLEDRLALPPVCGEYAVVRVAGREGRDDGAALYLDGEWASELSDRLLAGPGPALRLVRTGRLLLSPSGKVQRYLMAEEASGLLEALATLARRPSEHPAEVFAAEELVRVLFGDGAADAPRIVLTGATAATDCLRTGLPTGVSGIVVVLLADEGAAPRPDLLVDREFLAAWESAGLTHRALARVRTPTVRADVLWAMTAGAEEAG